MERNNLRMPGHLHLPFLLNITNTSKCGRRDGSPVKTITTTPWLKFLQICTLRLGLKTARQMLLLSLLHLGYKSYYSFYKRRLSDEPEVTVQITLYLPVGCGPL